MPETLTPARSLPLTDLSEDERMFRDQVRDFAETEVRPLVRKMDEESYIPRELIDKCFELGIMGIEIPESAGGAGATFFMSVLVVEELARVDASLAVLVDVQNTLVNNALLRWGPRSRRPATSRGSPPSGSAPMRCPRRAPARTRSRSPAAPPTRATTTS